MGKANERAKITQEQAEAIGLLRKAGMSVEELDMALRGDYEIVPKYSVGDYVVWREKTVAKIKLPQTYDIIDDGRCNFSLETSDGATLNNVPRSEIRHATQEEIAKEKERAFFAKHGRRRWELREGDVLVNVFSGDPAIVTGNSEDGYEIDGTPLHKKIVRNSYRVVAFVEGRLD